MSQFNANQTADIEPAQRKVGSHVYADTPEDDMQPDRMSRLSDDQLFETNNSLEPLITCGALIVTFSLALLVAYYPIWSLRYYAYSVGRALLFSTLSVLLVAGISTIAPGLISWHSGLISNFRRRFLLECVMLALVAAPAGLFFHINSVIASVNLVLAAAIAANSFRYLLPISEPLIDLDTESSTDRWANLIGSLEPYPANWTAFALSIVAQLALVALLTEHGYLSIVLFCVLSFTLVRELTIRILPEPRKSVNTQDIIRVLIFCAYSVAVIYIIIIPSSKRGPLFSALQRAMTPTVETSPKKVLLKIDRPENGYSSGYESIILWPPKKPHQALRMPTPQSGGPTLAARFSPLIIPFDGPYWYYKAPATAPDSHARVVHGNPARVNIHSSDRIPLKMEARQSLISPLSISCCRHLEVALTNADNSEGRISLLVAFNRLHKVSVNSDFTRI